jgi:hypothetical protein
MGDSAVSQKSSRPFVALERGGGSALAERQWAEAACRTTSVSPHSTLVEHPPLLVGFDSTLDVGLCAEQDKSRVDASNMLLQRALCADFFSRRKKFLFTTGKNGATVPYIHSRPALDGGLLGSKKGLLRRPRIGALRLAQEAVCRHYPLTPANKLPTRRTCIAATQIARTAPTCAQHSTNKRKHRREIGGNAMPLDSPTQQEPEHWRTLCEKAAHEEDLDQLVQLVRDQSATD